MSERLTISDQWPLGTEILELNSLGNFLVMPRLTEDEKIIFFQAADIDGGIGDQDIWMASRSDKNMPFELFRNISEINTTSTEAHPSISPDGLTLYFVSNRNGSEQIFKATRTSLDMSFSNVQHLSFFDKENECSSFPFITNDARTFYFVRYLSSDRSTRDVYVSYYYQDDSYYVDGANGNNQNDGKSSLSAFATIQKAIDTAPEGYTIFVNPGVYCEPIDFKGKAITIQGVAGPDGVPVLEAPNDFAVFFVSNEGPDTILKNVIIKNSFMGIFLVGSSPTISNVTIVDNFYGISAYAGANPDISNCIFWNNINGDMSGSEARYSWLQSQSSFQDISGLVHYWSFDEAYDNIVNDVISDKNGDIVGASWTEGVSGSALSFDGDNDYINFGDILDNEIKDEFTIGVWVKLADGALQKATNYVFWKDDDRPAIHIGSNGQVAFGHWYEGESGLHSSHVLEEEKWYYLLYKYDGSEFTGYVNAEYTGSHPDSGYSPGGNVRIGGDGNFTRYFKGKIDELMIFDRALADEEIMQLYEHGLYGGVAQSPMFVDPENGDYHLKSERGRYWPEHDVWVLDNVTSPCIDAGDPLDEPANEPMPNGGFLNMGAYGGTPYASMSDIPTIEADYNGDGIIDDTDLADLIEQWLAVSGWVEQ
ncbi:MAG: PD40 domain-containing protein [Sedimentisphaerales bacterium]|nr:PD40 domain-containing protein [Sedimentisphaerales bacterium]